MKIPKTERTTIEFTFIAQFAGDKIFARKNPFNPPNILREEIKNFDNIESWINADSQRITYYNLMLEKYKNKLSLPAESLIPKIKRPGDLQR